MTGDIKPSGRNRSEGFLLNNLFFLLTCVMKNAIICVTKNAEYIFISCIVRNIFQGQRGRLHE